MKTKTTKTLYPAHKSGGLELKEAVTMPGIGMTIPVRAAKAKLSALLELVARGQEVTITSDGQPKAVLSPVSKGKSRKVFTGTWEHLKKMPPWRGGPTAEEIVREDRDARGW
ncbi:MAG TPA: type II toxin-antitoxin system prevent-host-death family antitoxin [Verrucomicrobiae bacterium]|jgi:prevent-host-death family protein|nr:type II toxin-antitoxin system prevent-host-death family antitoxin [Verrucomicrobiae bacterium]